MRLRGWFSGGRLLALLSVANLLLGVGLFSVRSPERVDRNAPPPDLPAQIKALEALMDGNHRGQTFTLALTDAELSDAVANYLASSPDISFSDVRVTVGNGEVVINGKARGAALAVPVRATLAVGVENGTPVIRITRVSLGRTGLPKFVSDQIIAQANASLDLSHYDLGVTLESITLGEHVVTVRGTIK
jgi:hypothetical protein